MMNRVPLVLLMMLCGSAATTGCFQEFNPGADKGGARVELGIGEVPDPGDGTIPVRTGGFPIYDPDAGVVPDACSAVVAESTQIRQKYCSTGCHSGANPTGLPAFDILNDNQLMTTVVKGQTNPNTNQDWVVLVPGDPSNSYMYARIVDQTMPPKTQPPPTPTLSDISVLNFWITSCVSGGGGLAPTGAGGAPGPAVSGTGGATGTGGTPGAGGASGTGAGTVASGLGGVRTGRGGAGGR